MRNNVFLLRESFSRDVIISTLYPMSLTTDIMVVFREYSFSFNFALHILLFKLEIHKKLQMYDCIPLDLCVAH